MRCITIVQPYAWAVAVGVKIFENRKWSTNYVGPLAIHAGLSRERLGEGFVMDDLLIPEPREEYLVFGAIIAIGDLVACWPVKKIPKDKQHWSAEGPFCFEIRNVRQLKTPFRCRGSLSLWESPPGFALPGPEEFLAAVG